MHVVRARLSEHEIKSIEKQHVYTHVAIRPHVKPHQQCRGHKQLPAFFQQYYKICHQRSPQKDKRTTMAIIKNPFSLGLSWPPITSRFKQWKQSWPSTCKNKFTFHFSRSTQNESSSSFCWTYLLSFALHAAIDWLNDHFRVWWGHHIVLITVDTTHGATCFFMTSGIREYELHSLTSKLLCQGWI